MGPVNLVAIDEYQEVEERFNFLNSQHEDLVNAKTELEEVIARIDKQSREMFAETFEKVRANFQKMFPDLFGGGRADLVLTEEEDVLEAGVEIVASPPGKKLHRIGLLSGGEQTMTAVALLFSLYQVKPSPFVCWTSWTRLWMMLTSSATSRSSKNFSRTRSSLLSPTANALFRRRTCCTV